jgi:hypothetical protein
MLRDPTFANNANVGHRRIDELSLNPIPAPGLIFVNLRELYGRANRRWRILGRRIASKLLRV